MDAKTFEKIQFGLAKLKPYAYVVIDGCVREGKIVQGGLLVARRKTVIPLTGKLVRFSSLSEALRSRQARAVQIGDKRFVLQQRSR